MSLTSSIGAKRSSSRQFFPDGTIAARGLDVREGHGLYRVRETSSREIPCEQIKRLIVIDDFAKFGAWATPPSSIELDQRLDRGRGFGRSIGRKRPRQESERIVLKIVGIAFGGTLVTSKIVE